MKDHNLLQAFANVVPVTRRLEAGATLFLQGEKTFGIFRLLSGQIRLVRAMADGSETVIHVVQTGGLFAEAALFSEHYHCNAVATQAADVLVYPKDSLERQLRTNQDALWEFTAGLARSVQETRSRLEMRHIRSARERVLHLIRLRSDAKGGWRLSGTLKQFAGEVELTHEALYRTLAGLEQEGLIVRESGYIKLCNHSR